LPVIAAIGGFIVPAGIYAAFNWGHETALSGWATPCATDIAFALGICALLGRAVPASLKSFLLALAIIDDLLAIVVIAVFYTDQLSTLALACATVGVVGLIILNRLDVRAPALYVVIGVFTWVSVLKSGVHATLAGVAVGLAMPMTRHDGESLLERVEHALKPWVSYAIIPIFAFANAGVSVAGISVSALTASLPLGIMAALFVGKQLGAFLPSYVAIKLGFADQPAGATLGQLYGVAVLTGVGFTMSLFIGTLAFDDEATMAQVRLSVLIASFLSAATAAAILRSSRASKRAEAALVVG